MNRRSWLLALTLGVALIVHFALAEGVSARQSIDQVLWPDAQTQIQLVQAAASDTITVKAPRWSRAQRHMGNP